VGAVAGVSSFSGAGPGGHAVCDLREGAGARAQRDFFGVGSTAPLIGVFSGVSSHFFPGVTVFGVMPPGPTGKVRGGKGVGPPPC